MRLGKLATIALLAVSTSFTTCRGVSAETFKVSHVLPRDGHLGVGAQAFAGEELAVVEVTARVEPA